MLADLQPSTYILIKSHFHKVLFVNRMPIVAMVIPCWDLDKRKNKHKDVAVWGSAAR